MSSPLRRIAKKAAPVVDFARTLVRDLPLGQPTSLEAWRRTVRRLESRLAPPALDPRLEVAPSGSACALDAARGRFASGTGNGSLRLAGKALRRLSGRDATLRFHFAGPASSPFALHYDLGPGISPQPGRPFRLESGANEHRLHVPFGTQALVLVPPAGIELELRSARLVPLLRKRKKSPVEAALSTFDQGGGLVPLHGIEFRPGTEPMLAASHADPRLSLAHPPQHRGFYMVELQETFEVPRCVARFYPSLGGEPKEADAFSLPVRSGRLAKRIVHFAKAPKAMRFDPIERVSVFEVRHLAFVPVSERFAVERMSAKLRGRIADETPLELYARYDAAFRARSTAILDYAEWVAMVEPETRPSSADLLGDMQRTSEYAYFSLVMPVYETEPAHLRACIESVLAQSYPHFELCIADDASKRPEVRQVLEEYASRDSRVRCVFRGENGRIAAATNSALELANGDYVGFVDHDDVLDPDALLLMADAIRKHPGASVFYSDEDKLDAEGKRCEPHFKPDWNRDLLYGLNYVNHFCVYRRSLVESVGRLREGFDGSQDYDLLLRCIERIGDADVVHLPHVLYHWRMAETSTARSDAAKDHTTQASLRALGAHFERQGRAVRMSSPRPNFFRAHWPLPSPPPMVSIIMPTRDGVGVLRTAIESIRAKTTYPAWELVLLDNGSKEPETFRYFEELREDPRIRIVRDDRPFNFSALNNHGVRLAKGSVLALVNNDVEVISPGWLDEMVSLAIRPGTGCVGAKLYYANDTVQHAGVITGLGGVAGHSHKHAPRESAGYLGRLWVTQEVSAVTAACMVVRRALYEALSGLDEERFAVAFNDVDFCLRVQEAGYHNVFTPFAELYHHESVTRGSDETEQNRERFSREIAAMKARWGERLRRDPHYSPNLTLDREDFSMASRALAPSG